MLGSKLQNPKRKGREWWTKRFREWKMQYNSPKKSTLYNEDVWGYLYPRPRLHDSKNTPNCFQYTESIPGKWSFPRVSVYNVNTITKTHFSCDPGGRNQFWVFGFHVSVSAWRTWEALTTFGGLHTFPPPFSHQSRTSNRCGVKPSSRVRFKFHAVWIIWSERFEII